MTTAGNAPRRAQGTTATRGRKGMGSVSPRPDGRGFRVRWSDLDGARHERHAATEREGYTILRQELASRDAGTPVVGRRHTVATWMAAWYPTHQSRLRATSRYAYQRAVDAWSDAPGFGTIRLVDLRPVHVERQLARWDQEGVSVRSRRFRSTILRMALEAAQRSGYIATNVARVADMPKLPDVKYQPLAATELAALQAAITGHELEPVFRLALDAGLRQGEVLALQWRHVDLVTGIVTVDGTLRQDGSGVNTPKSTSSRRRLPLDRGLVAVLEAHRDRTWHGSRPPLDAWVFTRVVDGEVRPLSARLVLDAWYRVSEAAIGRRVRFHDLRHAFVSRALAHGVPLVAVSRYVGHSSVAITANVYGHLELTAPGLS